MKEYLDTDSMINPIALKMAKTPRSFGSSKCNRVKDTKNVMNNKDEYLGLFVQSIFSLKEVFNQGLKSFRTPKKQNG